MRTAVIDSKEAVTQIKDGDFAVAHLHGAAFAQRYVAAICDPNPRFRSVHAKVSSKGLI
jgi:hypothetical protein